MKQDQKNKIYIRIPSLIKAGEVVPVQIKMNHPMVTGWQEGISATKDRLWSVRCLFNGLEVFRADFGDGMAPDPYIAFFIRLKESGLFEVQWRNHQKMVASIKHKIKIL